MGALPEGMDRDGQQLVCGENILQTITPTLPPAALTYNKWQDILMSCCFIQTLIPPSKCHS